MFEDRVPQPLRFTDAYRAVHRLGDGTAVQLRLLQPGDRDWLLATFEGLSPGSRYFRFFAPMPRLTERAERHLLSVDGWDHVAIAAETFALDVESDTDSAMGIGVARFIRVEDSPDTAEVALAVVDQMQGRGVGRLLLRNLIEAARERDVTTLRAHVLTENRAMTSLLCHLQGSSRPRVEGSVATYEIFCSPWEEDPPYGAEGDHGCARRGTRGFAIDTSTASPR